MAEKHNTKMRSVLELAKYKSGDTPYWIITRPYGEGPIIDEDDEWAFSDAVHPKTLFEYKILNNIWPYRAKLPKLHAGDFQTVLDLLTCDLVVEQFEVARVIRCPHTGEFIYQNTTGEEWMPESLLFDTPTEAKRERDRIKKLIGRWSQQKSIDPQAGSPG